TEIALAPPRLRPLRRVVRMRQRWQRKRRLLVHERKLPPADAGGRCRRLPLPGLLARHGREGLGDEGTDGMKLRLWVGAVAIGVTAAAQSIAADVSMLGKWRIVEAVPAPWAPQEQQAALAAQGKNLLKTEVTFAPGTVISKFKPFNCKSKVLYEPNS